MKLPHKPFVASLHSFNVSLPLLRPFIWQRQQREIKQSLAAAQTSSELHRLTLVLVLLVINRDMDTPVYDFTHCWVHVWLGVCIWTHFKWFLWCKLQLLQFLSTEAAHTKASYTWSALKSCWSQILRFVKPHSTLTHLLVTFPKYNQWGNKCRWHKQKSQNDGEVYAHHRHSTNVKLYHYLSQRVIAQQKGSSQGL